MSAHIVAFKGQSQVPGCQIQERDQGRSSARELQDCTSMGMTYRVFYFKISHPQSFKYGTFVMCVEFG